MKRAYWLPIICPAIVFLWSRSSIADEVLLKNGDRITGTVVHMKDGKLSLKTEYAGEIAIDWSAVANLQMDATATVILSEKTSVQGFTEPAEPEMMKVRVAELAGPAVFSVTDVTAINPPPPPPVSKITGFFNLGVDIEKGNTDSEDYSFDAQTVARAASSRFTLGIEYSKEYSSDVLSTDKGLTYFRYDYFVGKHWYINANTSLERDEFANLASRAVIGLGGGYQFYDTERTKLSTEAGIAVVTEKYDVGEDSEYTAFRWSANFEQFLIKDRLKFFHWDEILVDFEDTSNYFARTRTGLRFPLKKYLQWTLQYNYDYDSIPAPGNEKDDSRFIASIGFKY